MKHFNYLKQSLEDFKPLVIDDKEEALFQADNQLNELISHLNFLVDNYERYFGKKPKISEIQNLISSEAPKEAIKHSYAKMSKEQTEELKVFSTDGLIDIIDFPDFTELIGSLNDSVNSLNKLNKIDTYFQENLNKFWNGSQFYLNNKAFDEFSKQLETHTKTHFENVFLTIVLNICEALNTLIKMGLNIKPGSLPGKLRILMGTNKVRYNSKIYHEFKPSSRIIKQIGEYGSEGIPLKDFVRDDLPEAYDLDHSFLFVGKKEHIINKEIGLLSALVDSLNKLSADLTAFYGQEANLTDVMEVVKANDYERTLKEDYIRKNDIKIPGIDVKIDKLIALKDFPDYSEISIALEKVRASLSSLREFGIFQDNLEELFNPESGKFEVSSEMKEKIEIEHSYYTKSYYENVVFEALIQLAKSLNQLKDLGYSIHLPSLPFKLQSLFQLEKETGNIYIKPDVFSKEDSQIKVKGLHDSNYRLDITKKEKIEFEDISSMLHAWVSA